MFYMLVSQEAIKGGNREIEEFLGYPSVSARIEEVQTQAADDAAAVAPPSLPQSGAPGSGPRPDPEADLAETTAGNDVVDETLTESDKAWEKLTWVDKKHWDDVILRNINTHVRFVVEGRTQAGTEHAIKACTLANIKADAAGTVLFHYDVKKAGESMNRPEYRHPPHRQEVYNKLIRGVLAGRSTAEKGAHLSGVLASF